MCRISFGQRAPKIHNKIYDGNGTTKKKGNHHGTFMKSEYAAAYHMGDKDALDVACA